MRTLCALLVSNLFITLLLHFRELIYLVEITIVGMTSLFESAVCSVYKLNHKNHTISSQVSF